MLPACEKWIRGLRFQSYGSKAKAKASNFRAKINARTTKLLCALKSV